MDETGFVELLGVGSLRSWRMAGEGAFRQRDEGLESEGGPGIYWYAAREFADFVLRVEWRVTTAEDNSGVFVRIPALGQSDPASDWQPAVEQGYEIQIDERGIDPATSTADSPLHRTGAIYALAPAAAGLSRPVGAWNLFEIEARGDALRVALNGRPASELRGAPGRRAGGHIGLQAHHPASRAQFRSVRLRAE